MGLLKHLLLPFLGLFHAYMAWATYSASTTTTTSFGFYETDVDAAAGSAATTLREMRLLGALSAFHLAFALNDLVSVGLENSHYRGMACVVEFVAFLVDAVQAYQLSSASVMLPLFGAGLAGSGLLVHSMEPGIFTRDKDQRKKQ